MEPDRGAAEDDDHGEADPQHRLDARARAPSSQPTCPIVATIAVAVASRMGAWSGGTRPSPITPPSALVGQRQRLRRKRRGELERREEQDDREQVEQQLHQAPLSVGVGIFDGNGFGSNFSDAELMQ